MKSIQKTGRLVVVDTSWAFCGVSAEIAAQVVEKGFSSLKEAVRRVTPLDCPAPVSKPLEDAFHPSPNIIIQACLGILKSDVSFARTLPEIQDSFLGPY